jgi:uncharacterized membrane protein (UPF0182 family)
MLYFRPLYVTSTRNNFPKLDYYIVVYAGSSSQSKVAFEPTLQGALNDLFQVNLAGPGSSSPPSSTGVSATVQNLINEANTDFQQAQTDLKNGSFAAYGTDITNLQNVLQKLQAASDTSPTTPVTKVPAKKSKTTTTTTAPATTTTIPSSVALGSPKG